MAAWRPGRAQDRPALARLEPHGWTVLHDLAVPGSRANIDHLVIGPPGVFVIDSKQYRGRLRQAANGSWWHGRYPLAPTLRAAQFEADQANAVLGAPRVPVLPVVVVHGASVPWGELVADRVPVVTATRLVPALGALPSILPPDRVAGLADDARVRFRAA